MKTAWQATSGRDDDLTTLSRAGQLLSSTVLSRMPAIRSMFANTQVYSADLGWTANAVRRLGTEFENTADVVLSAVQAVQRMVMTLDAPDPFVNTIDPFLKRLKPYLDELLPALATTGGPFISIFSAVNRTVPQIDLSTLLSNALQVAGTDGAARVTLTLPAPDHQRGIHAAGARRPRRGRRRRVGPRRRELRRGRRCRSGGRRRR